MLDSHAEVLSKGPSQNDIGKHNILTLCWVTEHQVNRSNENADDLANRGSRRLFVLNPFSLTLLVHKADDKIMN